jgi:hypothetical protein
MAKVSKNVLKAIVDGTRGADQYAMIETGHAEQLVKDGYIEVNAANQKDGKIAARATQTLLEQFPLDSIAPVKQVFTIDNGIVPPAAKRTGVKEEIYPFSQLQVGQSFFVPATKKQPAPAKAFASTVSSATRRFSIPHPEGKTRVNRKGVSVPVMVSQREFTIRAVKSGQKYDNGFTEKADGARVFRIA